MNETLEKRIGEVGLHRHNELCAYQMQIAYLNSYKACEQYDIDKDQYMFFYITSLHGKQLEGERE